MHRNLRIDAPMTTRAIRSVAAVGLALLGATACTDVTTEPQSTVSAANIFNDPGSYRAFLAKLYGGLAVTGQQGPAGQADIDGIDEGFSQYVRGLWQLQELPTDEVVIAWGDESLPELNTMGWGSANRFITAFYYRVFYQVALANEFLRETTDERMTARTASSTLRAQVEQYRAEARLLRAMSYWHGLDTFGNIPLVTEDTPLGVEPPAQTSRAELYAFVVSEIDAVRSQLPAAGAAEYGRFDQGAADMLLAKLYLNAEVYTGTPQYPAALQAAERVIASNAYTLDDRYFDIFKADNHTSPEIVYAVPFDGTNTRTYGGTTFLGHAAIGGDMDPGALGYNGGWWGLRVTPQFVALFPGGGPSSPDRRASIMFTTGQTLQINTLSDFKQGYAMPKYQNVTSSGEEGSNTEFPDVDYPMFRLADAYLMYAEAVLRGGGGSRSQALTYVNALRERAFGNTSGNITDAQLTLDFILDERGRELLWEGHRRTDLVRYGRFTGSTYIWSWKGGTQAGAGTAAYLDLYPLPDNELSANPNLKQNPGY